MVMNRRNQKDAKRRIGVLSNSFLMKLHASETTVYKVPTFLAENWKIRWMPLQNNFAIIIFRWLAAWIKYCFVQYVFSSIVMKDECRWPHFV